MPISLCRNFWISIFFLVLYFQVSLFGNSELENLKTNNTVYSLYHEIINLLLKYKLFNIILSSPIFKKFFNIQTKNYNNWNTINYDISLQWLISYSLFFIAVLYTLSFLPYGRFYNKLGGNFALLFSYFYIFGFLTFSFFRNSWILSNNKVNLINL